MEPQRGLVDAASEKVWNFFSSVKLAVVLLIILAVVSVIGTVIQQNQPTEEYLREYSLGTVQLFEALGFFDLYHTWWFILLLMLFTANLLVCTLERFPRAWRQIRAPLKPLEDDGLKAVPFKKEFMVKGTVEQAAERALAALKSKGFAAVLVREAGALHIASQKGAYSRLGVYITHLSVILVFVGALIGAFFGYKAFLNLPEGEASPVVYLRNEPMWDRIMDTVGIAKSPVIPNPEGGVPAMPLGFYVRCDDFEVDYYTNAGRPTGMPSEYHSKLTVFDSLGRKVLDKRIRVNDPLTHHGITFYQSSYGTMPNAVGKVLLTVRQKNGAGAPETVVVDPGGKAYIKSIDRTIAVHGVAPFGIRDPQTGQVMFYRSDNNEFINPVVDVEVLKGTKPVFRTQVLKVDAAEPPMPEHYVIRYGDYWGARYTGLQVTKDPGVWVVYLGFILLCGGPLVAFFGSHRKIWMRIQDRKGQAAVLVAGSSNRNRFGFENEFNSISKVISA